MKILKLIPALVLVAGLSFTGCKPKDADVKAKIEKSLKEDPSTAGVMVMVDKGVATLSGEVADETARTTAETKAKAVKGVETVQNNTTTAPVPQATAPVEITADDPLASGVRDATKDFPGVNATVNDGVITLTGEISKASNQKLMMALNTLKPKKIDNKLTIK
jgi:osmotically-inducible protein OsmY